MTGQPAGPGGADQDRDPDAGAHDAARALTALHRDAAVRLAELSAAFDDLVAASSDSNADDEHDPEGATIAFERSQLDAMVRRAQAHLDEIEEARGRLLEGRYGTCEVCGRPIAPARLEARPTARTCIDCAAR